MRLMEILKADVARLEDGEPSVLTVMKWYFFPKGSTYPHTFWMRVVQWSKELKIRKYTIGIIAYQIEKHMSYKFGVHVDTNTKIGGVFKWFMEMGCT